MTEHPCPLPKKRRKHRGRHWTCSCGRMYWLLEADDYGTYFDIIRFLDDGPDWQWIEARIPRNGSSDDES